MNHEMADDFPDISIPLSRPRWGRRLHPVPDPQPSEAELALRAAEAELEAVKARGPVIAAIVADLDAAVQRLAAALL